MERSRASILARAVREYIGREYGRLVDLREAGATIRRRDANTRPGRADFYSRRDEGLGCGSNEEAIQACRDAITDRISRDGYTRVNIRSAQVDNNPGRNSYIVGTAVACGRGSMVDFGFSCAMNINNGRVRSVQLNLVRNQASQRVEPHVCA